MAVILGADAVVLSADAVQDIALALRDAGWPTPEYQGRMRDLDCWHAVNEIIDADLWIQAAERERYP